MNKITSFTIDHIRLIPGIYVSRKDSVNGHIITTFDSGNVQIADGTAYPRVLRLEGDLLKRNAAILPIGAGSQHQTVPAPQHRAASGDQRFPAPLNSSHDDSLRQTQLADGPSGPRILLR